MDIIDSATRADDLIMDIARQHTEQNLHELMQDADLHRVRFHALSLVI